VSAAETPAMPLSNMTVDTKAYTKNRRHLAALLTIFCATRFANRQLRNRVQIFCPLVDNEFLGLTIFFSLNLFSTFVDEIQPKLANSPRIFFLFFSLPLPFPPFPFPFPPPPPAPSPLASTSRVFRRDEKEQLQTGPSESSRH